MRSVLYPSLFVFCIMAFDGIATSQTLPSENSSAPVSGQNEHPLLPPGEGRDLVIQTCSQCHDPDRVAKERRTLGDFQALMVEMQGNGLTAPEDDLDKIAHYLANAFPPSLPLPGK